MLDEQQEKFLSIQKEQLEIIKCIDKDRKTMYIGDLEKKYKDFMEKYPKTWLNLLDNKFVVSHLERKIELYEKMYRKSGGSHEKKKFNADVFMGERIADEYLYPSTGKPSTKDHSKAYNLAKEKTLNPDNNISITPSKKLDIEEVD